MGKRGRMGEMGMGKRMGKKGMGGRMAEMGKMSWGGGREEPIDLRKIKNTQPRK
jgi:hypothetical protein